MKTASTSRTLVLGDGGWGTALALALHRAGRKVVMWSYDPAYAKEVAATRINRKFLPGVEIPPAIQWTHDREEALENVDEFYCVVPTQFIRTTLGIFADRLRSLAAISASKGIELDTFKKPSEIIQETSGCSAVAVLSGPSHAEEVATGLATTVVVASESPELAVRTQERLSQESLRVYTGKDVAGLELGGGLKNVIAVAAGVGDGLGLGDNAKAALVTRGLIEMSRFGERLGAARETFFGLSGAGDLMVTCYSRHSRNRAFGERLGRGESMEKILADTEKVAEGVWTCRAVREMAQQLEIEMPITEKLHQILFDKQDPHTAVRELMLRPSRAELDPVCGSHQASQ